MLNLEDIPDAARLHKEEKGVKWYTAGERIRSTYYMEFEGRVVMGSWVGPRWVFWALTSMSPEERVSYLTHDECMGAITTLLAQRKGGRVTNCAFYTPTGAWAPRTPTIISPNTAK